MLGRLFAILLAAVGVLAAMVAPAEAEQAVPALAWSAPSFATESGRPVTIGGTLVLPEAPPDQPAPVLTVERRESSGAWVAVPSTLSGATFSAKVAGTTATYRASVTVGDQTVSAGPTEVVARPASSTLTFTMPSALKDYRTATITARWRRGFDGLGLSGKAVVEFRRAGTKTWKKRVSITVAKGSGSVRITHRDDGRFRVRWAGSAAVAARTSATRAFDNRPPGTVVKLPKGASRPSITLPAQPRSTRKAAAARTSRISDAMWASMKGRSWRSGCPVGRGDLRVVRVSYWAFDGYVRRGEIVVNASVAKRTASIFTDLFRSRVPIRSMYRVDRFGYSTSLRGADDVKSMKADNTSGFNCRWVVGRPGVRSPHATGRSIDLNPWENPYVVGGKRYPNASWHRRSKPASITWRGSGDPVVTVFRKHGFRWLGASDLHHFQRS